MIGEISYGKNVYSAISYNEDKILSEQAELILVNNFFNNDISTVVPVLRSYAQDAQVDDYTFHVSLNLSPQDRELSNKEFCDIASNYMQEMGYGDNPYIVYRHRDKDHQHVHIVTSRTDTSGKLINQRFEFYKSMSITQSLEKKYMLIHAQNQGINVEEKKSYVNDASELRLDDRKGVRAYIARNLREIKDNTRFSSVEDFKKLTKERGIETKIVDCYEGQKGVVYVAKINGLEYHPIKASDIYHSVSFKSIEKIANRNVYHKKKFDTSALKENVLSTLKSFDKTDIHTFKSLMLKKEISVLYDSYKNGEAYGLSFFDRKSGMIFKGSELDKNLSFSNLKNKIANKETELSYESLKKILNDTYYKLYRNNYNETPAQSLFIKSKLSEDFLRTEGLRLLGFDYNFFSKETQNAFQLSAKELVLSKLDRLPELEATEKLRTRKYIRFGAKEYKEISLVLKKFVNENYKENKANLIKSEFLLNQLHHYDNFIVSFLNNPRTQEYVFNSKLSNKEPQAYETTIKGILVSELYQTYVFERFNQNVVNSLISQATVQGATTKAEVYYNGLKEFEKFYNNFFTDTHSIKLLDELKSYGLTNSNMNYVKNNFYNYLIDKTINQAVKEAITNGLTIEHTLYHIFNSTKNYADFLHEFANENKFREFAEKSVFIKEFRKEGLFDEKEFNTLFDKYIQSHLRHYERLAAELDLTNGFKKFINDAYKAEKELVPEYLKAEHNLYLNNFRGVLPELFLQTEEGQLLSKNYKNLVDAKGDANSSVLGILRDKQGESFYRDNLSFSLQQDFKILSVESLMNGKTFTNFLVERIPYLDAIIATKAIDPVFNKEIFYLKEELPQRVIDKTNQQIAAELINSSINRVIAEELKERYEQIKLNSDKSTAYVDFLKNNTTKEALFAVIVNSGLKSAIENYFGENTRGAQNFIDESLENSKQYYEHRIVVSELGELVKNKIDESVKADFEKTKQGGNRENYASWLMKNISAEKITGFLDRGWEQVEISKIPAEKNITKEEFKEIIDNSVTKLADRYLLTAANLDFKNQLAAFINDIFKQEHTKDNSYTQAGHYAFLKQFEKDLFSEFIHSNKGQELIRSYNAFLSEPLQDQFARQLNENLQSGFEYNLYHFSVKEGFAASLNQNIEQLQSNSPGQNKTEYLKQSLYDFERLYLATIHEPAFMGRVEGIYYKRAFETAFYERTKEEAVEQLFRVSISENLKADFKNQSLPYHQFLHNSIAKNKLAQYIEKDKISDVINGLYPGIEEAKKVFDNGLNFVSNYYKSALPYLYVQSLTKGLIHESFIQFKERHNIKVEDEPVQLRNLYIQRMGWAENILSDSVYQTAIEKAEAFYGIKLDNDRLKDDLVRSIENYIKYRLENVSELNSSNMILVSLIDDILKDFFKKEKAKMHPLGIKRNKEQSADNEYNL
jgi:hypothetical protein